MNAPQISQQLARQAIEAHLAAAKRPPTTAPPGQPVRRWRPFAWAARLGRLGRASDDALRAPDPGRADA